MIRVSSCSDCVPGAATLPLPTVGTEPWQKRMKRAGLSQKELARLVGLSENAVSSGLRGVWRSGVPRHIRTIIRLWEIADRKQREAILENPETDADAWTD